MMDLNPTDAEREAKVRDIKDQIQRGEYRIDDRAVADAIVRRLRERAHYKPAKGPKRRTQTECSYPANSSGPSVNTTPAGPSATRPIQVSEPGSPFARLASIIPRTTPGTQAQSS
jgi:anti-sigma-28 factor FlgM